MSEVLLWIALTMGTIIIVLIAILLRRINDIRDEGITHYKEAVALLQGTLALAASARDSRKETTVAAEAINVKLEEVPEKTAKRVVEVAKESRDDWRAQDKPT